MGFYTLGRFNIYIYTLTVTGHGNIGQPRASLLSRSFLEMPITGWHGSAIPTVSENVNYTTIRTVLIRFCKDTIISIYHGKKLKSKSETILIPNMDIIWFQGI